MSGEPDAADVLVVGRHHIPLSELRFTFSRSGGPGGQNVNKVNTRVTLHFDLDGCEVFDEQQKRRIQSRLRRRIDKSGVLRIISSRHRTQLANRQAAIERLGELLTAALHRDPTRRPTSIPRSAVRRRLNEKSRRSQTKQQRRRPSADD